MDLFIEHVYDKFFMKMREKTSHEGLYNTGGTHIPGHVPSAEERAATDHFYTHINYHTMKQALITLHKNNPDRSDFCIVETGCAAHGTKSTLLWDKFVTTFGGNVYSVDLNSSAVQFTNSKVSEQTKVTCSDSLAYLPTLTKPIDFLYLDSYDVDFMNPLPSAAHHLKEFNCVKHLLHKGSVVLIDDTIVSPDWLDGGINHPIYRALKSQFDPEMSGKGSLVAKELERMGAVKIMHQYQMLWVL
jgi:hypothetical protein